MSIPCADIIHCQLTCLVLTACLPLEEKKMIIIIKKELKILKHACTKMTIFLTQKTF